MVDCGQARNLYYLNEEIKAEQLAAERKLKKKLARRKEGCF
jgi:hypothetical protein